MKRIEFTGLPFEVIQATARNADTGQPEEVRVIRWMDPDSNTLMDFPLSLENWEQLKAMGDARPDDDPLKGFEVVKQMPGVLRQEPPPRPPR
jgi:hypothetical protein